MTSPDSADAGKASANAEAEPKKESETTDASAAKAEQVAAAVVSDKSEKVEQSEPNSDPDKSKPVEAVASDDAAPAEADGAADADGPAGDDEQSSAAEAEPVAVKKAPRGRAAKRKDAVVLPRPNKQELISTYQKKSGDTGSSEVQVALLTARISHLTSHLKVHPKDKHTERGLLLLVNQRRKLLDYLNGKDPSSYRSLIGQLNLRR